MSEVRNQHSGPDVALIQEALEYQEANSLQGPLFPEAQEELRRLVEQFEVLRQAEEAARVQERVGNEGDADAIRRSAIAQVLKLGIYADLNPAKRPE